LESNYLPPSSIATLPPQGTGAIVLLEAPVAAAPPLLSRLAGGGQQPSNAESQPSHRSTIPLPGVPSLLPSAFGPALAKALDDRWQTYRKQLRQCREEFTEEGVHELRVATRRLLAQFVLLECVAPSASLEKGRRILKRRLAALGDLRDTQVQRLFVGLKTARFPELALLHAWLRRRERRLVRSAAGKVNRWGTRKLERRITAMAAELTANTRGSRAQCQLASAVLRATANAFTEAVQRRQAIDLADPRTIHQTRVAFKRFRYMMESLSPALTGLSKRQLRTLAYYQRRMGIIQDLEVLQRCIARFIHENRKLEPLLRPFCRHLKQRRARALHSFLKSADRLFEFWPPDRLVAAGHSSPNWNAA
jgi:CHAD domain-containing protein